DLPMNKPDQMSPNPASVPPKSHKTKITVYQIVDDSTRYDVGTSACVDPENGTDAVTTVRAAIAAHGVPQELLSDNGSAFNLARQGAVTALQMYLADQGCKPISGRIKSPTTQGKNERSHQTICQYFDAHAPKSVDSVHTLIEHYREYYNHRRHHQSLPGEMTPAQAWDAIEHQPSNGMPISHADLIAEALAYRDERLAKTAIEATVEENLSVVDKGQASQHTASGRLRETAGEIVIKRDNPQVYLHGKMLKVPTHLVGTYGLVMSETEYMLFDTTDGAEAIGFPLPLETKETKGRLVPLWKVRGARIRGPKPSWTQRHLAYEAEHYPTSADDAEPGQAVSTNS
ncbi:MAG: integrase core domain-containing protein, partial [Brevibacterium sp.]|nr:integrase core domain-containing protein [Brevibacterium sp.]